MKAAFAKLLQTDPVQSSHTDFRAGGNGVPILTRASGQSTAGYQTMGLPGGNKPYPGGGANKTSLGPIRMGDDEGNGPASAIVGGVGEIFFPFRAPDRTYPERTFPNVGNNVFQPENNDMATHALLKRLGDQKFKAESQAPFEDYRAEQRLVRDLEEASRGASLADLGQSREIIRNLAEKRRQQNEDDYLRKMLDAGATPEAAKKEIEDVRNANALQEAKKVDDRSYQAKMLIQRLSMARGVTPMVREPLNQSSSIDNPQRSQAMSEAMGMPGEGFGTSPLDMNRLLLTPEYYKRFLRKSTMTQEAADEQQAFNTMLAEGEIKAPAQGSFSLATLKGQERQLRVDNASEALAARLESIRSRRNKIINPLPANIIGKDILDKLYDEKDKVKGNRVLFSLNTIEDLRPLQLLIALNLIYVSKRDGESVLRALMTDYTWGSEQRPDENLLMNLKKLIVEMNGGELNVAIPFVSAMSPAVSMNKLASILTDIKTSNNAARAREHAAGYREYAIMSNAWDDMVRTRPADSNIFALETLSGPFNPNSTLPTSMTTRPIPGAGQTVVSTPDVLPSSSNNLKQALSSATSIVRNMNTTLQEKISQIPPPARGRGLVRKDSVRSAAVSPATERVRRVPLAPSLTKEGVKSLSLDQILEELASRGIDMGRKTSDQSLRKLLRDNL